MKEIKLTQGKVALIDDEDYEYFNQWNWFAHKDHHTYYAGRSINVQGHQKQLWMHRELLDTPQGRQVDHIDHNGLNNQKSNLRNCTFSQNMVNKTTCSKTGYLGVSFYDFNRKKSKGYDMGKRDQCSPRYFRHKRRSRISL
jgi:hypothetical protein